ncbi:unnamed protein product [Trichobilharzia regenti]|nr:unnamed protein product [Trichobilharzia regenti]
MDATESNGNCQLAITSPIPSTRQRYGLYLPPPTPSPELTPLTSPIITDNSSTPTTLVDSKQNTLPITQERRETPEGFTSFLSPTPNKSYVFTKTLTSDNSIRNVKSSIDLMKDINEENLMSHRSKCFTPEVHISPTLASSSVSNSVKNTTINGTLESFSKSQQKSITTSDFDTVVVVQENPDVLKWDYAGDLASNRLDISRINSQLNIASSTSTSNCCSSSRPINMPIDFIDYDASVALTWPSSGVHLSPPSRYGYLFHKKYNFNRTLNQNNLCNYFLRKNRYGIKIETGLSTSALSAGVLNQGSFISSPDPEDDDGAVYNSLPLHSGDNSLSPYKYRNRQHHGYQQEYRHHHHYSQSPINFHDILDDELESDENSQKLTSKTSDSNDQQQHHHHQEHQETEEEDKEGTDNDNDDKTNNLNVTLNQICLNTSQSVTELQHFANRVLKATEAAEEQLRQRINHLSAVMDKTVSDEKAMDEPPEPRARTSLACQSIECTDAYQSLQREDNKQEDTLILQSSTKINHPITNDTNNEIYYDNNEENLRILQSGLQQQQEEEGEHQSEEDQQQQQNDLSSLWTTSISDRTDDASNSFAYINDDVHMKDVSKQQQQQQSLIYSTDLPQLLLDDSAMTTVTPMNENLHCETGGYVVGVESCRSSIIVDGNLGKLYLHIYKC